MKSPYISIGEISNATLRKEHLIPSFISKLRNVRLSRTSRAKINKIKSNMKKEDYYDSEEADWDMEELEHIMDEACPPYCYFGTLEGDGACFGVWPSIESAEDVPRFEAGTELPKDFFGEFFSIDDHGNLDFGVKHRNGHVKWIWSAV